MSGIIERIMDLAGLLERIAGMLTGLSMVVCLLTGCQSLGTELPESFDEERMEEEALRAIDCFNEKDYQSVLDMGCTEFQEFLTAEEFAEQCDPILDKRGKFREIIKTVSMGCKNEEGEVEYGGLILVADYEDGRICFHITINENMELMEFLVQ
ncbi:MAG: DUF3887 domain-containing protein [Ruminococcus sp.]|jgi:hypothetical protein|nr:DUF3887 domain-containing protein [Ruminococcus sp.]